MRSLRNTAAPKQLVAKLLTELGINPTRLVMPTKPNVERLEALQGAASSLLDMKKTVDRVEQDIRTVTAQIQVAQGVEEGDEDDEMSVAAEEKPSKSQAIVSLMSLRSREWSLIRVWDRNGRCLCLQPGHLGRIIWGRSTSGERCRAAGSAVVHNYVVRYRTSGYTNERVHD